VPGRIGHDLAILINIDDEVISHRDEVIGGHRLIGCVVVIGEKRAGAIAEQYADAKQRQNAFEGCSFSRG